MGVHVPRGFPKVAARHMPAQAERVRGGGDEGSPALGKGRTLFSGDRGASGEAGFRSWRRVTALITVCKGNMKAALCLGAGYAVGGWRTPPGVALSLSNASERRCQVN